MVTGRIGDVQLHFERALPDPGRQLDFCATRRQSGDRGFEPLPFLARGVELEEIGEDLGATRPGIEQLLGVRRELRLEQRNRRRKVLERCAVRVQA